MSGSILTLLAASLAACVIELLVPKGDGGRIAAYVRTVAGLFLLVALLDPLRAGLRLVEEAVHGDLVGSMESHLPSDVSADYEEVFSSSLVSVGKGETEDWVTETLDSVFGIPPSDCGVEAILEGDGGEMTLREIRIGLKGAHALDDPHPIEDYYTRCFGCPCYVTVIR